jgi:two-component system chemotaxis response regulator CheY
MDIESVLIVDDSPTSRMIIKRCFEIAGYGEPEYLFASDGMEALQILDDRAVDLLVTDLNMPNCGGIALLQKVRHNALNTEMRIILVSSFADIADYKNGSDILGVINKPVSPQKIREVMGGN